MNFQEINQDRRVMSTAGKMEKYLDAGFSSRAKTSVNNHAITAGIALALPLFGLDNIIYIVTLWHMYSSLCSLAGKSFYSNFWKSIISGFLVNIIVCTFLEWVVSFIPLFGFLGAFIIGYASIKLSGAAYLKVLESMHNGNVNERYSFTNAMNYKQIQSNPKN